MRPAVSVVITASATAVAIIRAIVLIAADRRGLVSQRALRGEHRNGDEQAEAYERRNFDEHEEAPRFVMHRVRFLFS